MKVGQVVTYVGPDGAQQPATVTALVEHGPSLFWSLGLQLGDDTKLPNVPHQQDAGEHAAFWCLGDPGTPEPATRGGSSDDEA